MREVGKLVPDLSVFFVCVLVCGALALPGLTHAAFKDKDKECGATNCVPGGTNKKLPCSAVPPKTDTVGSGKTTCQCVSGGASGKCVGTGFNTPGGDMKGAGPLGDMLSKIFGEVLKELLKPKPPGGGGGGTPDSRGLEQQYPPCTVNPATKTVSPIPCRDTNGAINYGGTGSTDLGQSLGSNLSDQLLNALGIENTDTNTNTNVSDTLLNANQQTSTTSGVTVTQAQLELALQQQGLSPEDARKTAEAALQGDISISGSGVTIYARSRDVTSNIEVAGFYGLSTFGPQQSQSLIGRLCSSRPWSGGFMGAIIRPTFFDGLCTRAGYQVGQIVLTEQLVSSSSSFIKRPTITVTQPKKEGETTVAPPPQPQVDIWADPPNVRLGSRTYIFWNTKGVVSCKETGPSFAHNTLLGGAATVPISDSSTYVIECKTAEGTILADTVRVNLEI